MLLIVVVAVATWGTSRVAGQVTGGRYCERQKRIFNFMGGNRFFSASCLQVPVEWICDLQAA